MYKEMRRSFEESYKRRSALYRQRLAAWNDQAPIVRLAKPTNIARARALGYKAKQGVITVRVRVRGGTKKRHAPGGGRKPSKSGRFFTRHKSMRAIAEERAARRYINTEVLNSYFAGRAGTYGYYEVIMLDRRSPSVANDAQYSGVTRRRGRAFRGMSSAGRRHRQMA